MNYLRDYNHLKMLSKDGSLIVYNQLTGLFFEINENVEELIYKYEQLTLQELSDLEQIILFLKKYHLVDVDNQKEFFKTLYPKVNPFAIWNAEIIVFPASGQYEVRQCSGLEATIFESCDGSKTIQELSHQLGLTTNSLIELLCKWTTIEKQVIKLFITPYKEYLVNYFKFPFTQLHIHHKDAVIDLDYYYKNISNGEAQFEGVETTISYLLRKETSLLGRKKYGARFCEAVLDRSHLPLPPIFILEVGGGLGDFANASLEYLTDLFKPHEFSYTICDLSPELISCQQERCKRFLGMMNFVQGRGENLPFEKDTFNIVLSNEVIADFINVNLTEIHNEEKNHFHYSEEFNRVIEQYCIDNSGIKSSYLNLGAILFLEGIMRILKPGGIAVITEYSELDRTARISNYVEDHKEVAIDFELVSSVASQIGFEYQLLDLDEFLNVDCDALILNINNYEALKEGMRFYGQEIQKLIYDKECIEKLNAKYHFHNLRYNKSAELLGLFKVLILKKNK